MRINLIIMKINLRNILSAGLILIASLVIGCKNNQDAPAAAAKTFYDALAKKDFTKASEFATKNSKTMLELIQSMSEMGAEVAGNKDMEKMKTAIYSTDKIEGDKATVRVKYGETEDIITLKKEEGAWKVALDKESLQETISEKSSGSGDKIQKAIEDASIELEGMSDSLAKSLEKVGDAPKSDSLKKAGKP